MNRKLKERKIRKKERKTGEPQWKVTTDWIYIILKGWKRIEKRTENNFKDMEITRKAMKKKKKNEKKEKRKKRKKKVKE